MNKNKELMKININKGFVIKYKNNIFKPILKKWFKCNNRYCTISEIDPEGPYEYNERATLSTFAAAIWMAGGIALEEYCYTKHHGKRNKDYEGRIDLYFKYNDNDFAGEAKQVFNDINHLSKSVFFDERIYELLKATRKQVKRIPSNQGKRISIIFITPYVLYRKKTTGEINNKIRSTIYNSMKFNNVLCAWYFPEILRSSTAEHKYREGDYYFPGVILIIKKLR